MLLIFRKRISYLVILGAILFLSGCRSGEEHGQAANGVNLNPIFKTGMAWKETIVMNSNEEPKLIKMSAEAEVTDVQPEYLTVKYAGIAIETEDDPLSLVDGMLHGRFNEKFLLEEFFEEKGFREAWVVLPYAFEEFSLIGFIPPPQPVKVGETWSETGQVALGLEALQLKAKDVQGLLKLKSVEIKDGRSVAQIVWTGSCRIGKEEEDLIFGPEKMSWTDIGLFTWERTITFDLENRRVLQWIGGNTIPGEGGVPWKKTYKRTFEYK
jgi:hypothetical protein